MVMKPTQRVTHSEGDCGAGALSKTSNATGLGDVLNATTFPRAGRLESRKFCLRYASTQADLTPPGAGAKNLGCSCPLTGKTTFSENTMKTTKWALVGVCALLTACSTVSNLFTR